MLITRTSILTGETRTIDLPVTVEQVVMWESGVLVQDAMPNLNESEREFFISGITPSEWEELMAWEPEEDGVVNHRKRGSE